MRAQLVDAFERVRRIACPSWIQVGSQGHIAARTDRERCTQRTRLLLGGLTSSEAKQPDRDERRSEERFHEWSVCIVGRLTPVNVFQAWIVSQWLKPRHAPFRQDCSVVGHSIPTPAKDR